jgi:hypothetical protein
MVKVNTISVVVFESNLLQFLDSHIIFTYYELILIL